MQLNRIHPTISRPIAILFMAGGLAFAQGPADTRAVIDRTQQDLHQAGDFERQHHHDKEVSRYENAQRHLSDFDRDYTRGHFDKGKLNDAIDNVKDVVDHNTLDPQERDALRGDLQALRDLRRDH